MITRYTPPRLRHCWRDGDLADRLALLLAAAVAIVSTATPVLDLLGSEQASLAPFVSGLCFAVLCVELVYTRQRIRTAERHIRQLEDRQDATARKDAE